MKNFLKTSVFVLLSLSFFACEKSNEPLPYADTASGQSAVYESSPDISNAMQVGNPIVNKAPQPTGFEWKLMKSVTVPMNKGLNLSSPFAIVNEDAGDISWGSDGGCYSAIRCWKVTRAILGIVDFKSVTPDFLNMLTFVNSQVAWAPGAAPGYTPTWTNYMPVGTAIAYKTSLGKFRIVVVKSTSPLVLDIYHENYYRTY